MLLSVSAPSVGNERKPLTFAPSGFHRPFGSASASRERYAEGDQPVEAWVITTFLALKAKRVSRRRRLGLGTPNASGECQRQLRRPAQPDPRSRSVCVRQPVGLPVRAPFRIVRRRVRPRPELNKGRMELVPRCEPASRPPPRL